MRIEYLSPTGVVQTTKVEGPVPETGPGFFDLSLQLHRCRSLPLPFDLHFSIRQFPNLSCTLRPSPSARGFAQNAFEGKIRQVAASRRA
jgi:hypothetical protein